LKDNSRHAPLSSPQAISTNRPTRLLPGCSLTWCCPLAAVKSTKFHALSARQEHTVVFLLDFLDHLKRQVPLSE
jgi:hypothetical protein